MSDAPIIKRDLSSEVKYNVALDKLYNRIYSAFTDELGLICPYSEFNNVIPKDVFMLRMSNVLDEHDISSPTAHAEVLGFVAPGIHSLRAGGMNVSPADAAASMFNIARVMFPETTFSVEQFAAMFNVDIDVAIGNMADAIGEGMKTIKIPGGANIFNRGGRDGNGSVNDEGELIIDPPSSSAYMHHEPVKSELNWSMLLENTMQGTEPYWDSYGAQTCFVGKFNMIQFPNDDTELRNYYEKVLIPVLRNAVQANKRYNADLSTFFTYDMFKQYINEVIQSIAIYYFFANGFAYCNQPGLVNNNEALRYLRQTMFSTAQLQRFQQLGQMLDSLPIPQTLINAVAQYHGWYSNSTEANATLYCNIPHGIFLDNLYSASGLTGQTGCLDQLKIDVIQDEINKLNAPFVDTNVPATDKKNSDKFLALLLNTIPGWRNSTVGGSYFATDVYDEAHWNEFMNSPIVASTTLYTDNPNLQRSTHKLYPLWTGDADDHRYHTMGDKVPGYLQAYFTPLAWSAPPSYTGVDAHGLIKPQPKTVNFNMPHQEGSILGATTSNMIVWVNGNLFDFIGISRSRGFTLFPVPLTAAYGPNISSPLSWFFDNGERYGIEPHVAGRTVATDVQPPCTYRTTNMSLNQCMPNRLLAIQKLLDIQDFFSITSPGAPRESKPSGRRGRRGKSKKADAPEVTSEDFKDS